MIIVDSTTIIRILGDKQSFGDIEMLVPDDLYEEYLTSEVRHGRKVPNVHQASSLSNFSEAVYLRKYAEALNSYSDVSFEKMRGFGDVSIIALVACLVTNFESSLPQATLDLGDSNSEKITVVTNDKSLKLKLMHDHGDFINVIEYDQFVKH